MSLLLLQSALLLPLESLLKRLISMDSKSPARLRELEGHTLAIHSSMPDCDLYISFRNHSIALSPVFEGVADASLRGTAANLLQVLIQQTAVNNLAPYQVQLTGSTAFVQQVQTLLKELDIDWEFHLSRLIGDLPVAGLSKGMEKGREFAADTGSRASASIREYLIHESGLLPSREAAEQLYSDIASLSIRVDRLQARINLL